MKSSLFVAIAAVCSLIVAWCTSSGPAIEQQTITFDNFAMSIANDFSAETPATHYNSRLGSRPITLFTRPGSTDTKENIIVTKLPHNPKTSSLYAATNVMANTIAQTFGNYNKITLRKRDINCSNQTMTWYMHSYAVSHGTLDSISTHYVSQYYFVTEKWMYLLSALTEAEETIQEYEWYWKKISCDTAIES